MNGMLLCVLFQSAQLGGGVCLSISPYTNEYILFTNSVRDYDTKRNGNFFTEDKPAGA